jgi:nicotinate phosphoribosyltransferase
VSRNALFADLYEFTMLCAYFELGMTEQATFSLFVRNLPARRNFLIAAGLDDLLNEIEHLRFESEQIDYLRSLRLFPQPFLDWLKEFRFSGDIYAMREGTPCLSPKLSSLRHSFSIKSAYRRRWRRRP